MLTPLLARAGRAFAKINQRGTRRLLRGLAMRRRSALMRMIVENSFDAIMAITESGEIRTANPAAEAMFGYAAGELTGRNAAALLAGGSVQDAETHAAPATDPASLGELLAQTGTRQIVTADRHGARKYLDLAISRMMLGQEHLAILIAHDVTERVEMEQALLHAKEVAELSSRSKTEFVHNMSHELRTPLNAIIGFSEVMRHEIFGPLSERYAAYADDIHESGHHLLAVINDILDVAKIESGRFELMEEEIGIGEILDSAIRLIRGRAIRGGVTLMTPGKDGLPMLRGDGRVLKQVLLNLLDNAVKFTSAGGRIKVSIATMPAGSVEISVVDSGIGIPPEQVEHAMEPFGQVDSSLSRRHGGTGLGLPLAKRFMEMHGGSLTLTSVLGVGTTVTVRFPPERVVYQHALVARRVAS